MLFIILRIDVRVGAVQLFGEFNGRDPLMLAIFTIPTE